MIFREVSGRGDADLITARNDRLQNEAPLTLNCQAVTPSQEERAALEEVQFWRITNVVVAGASGELAATIGTRPASNPNLARECFLDTR